MNPISENRQTVGLGHKFASYVIRLLGICTDNLHQPSWLDRLVDCILYIDVIVSGFEPHLDLTHQNTSETEISRVNLNRRGNKRLKSFGSKLEPPTTVHRAQ